MQTTQPINYSTNELINYTLLLADDALIMGHRLSEWTGHGPILEQDIAVSNIALDYIGQARNFYQYAASLKGEGTTEDSFAYLRDASDFKNHLLAELPNGDWAQSILKTFFFSAYQFFLYQQLIKGNNEQISAIAEKSLKETTYHLRWSSEWVIRLGDGTDESHQRMKNALGYIYMFTGELFDKPSYDIGLIDYDLLKTQWQQKINAVFTEATVTVPSSGWMQSGGIEGKHTEHLGFILAEMQFLQRAYPNCEW